MALLRIEGVSGMGYFKDIRNGYVIAVGSGGMGTEITETEYIEILTIIRNKPTRTETTDYRLKADLTWEAYQVEPAPEPEPTDADKAEAYDILIGEQE